VYATNEEWRHGEILVIIVFFEKTREEMIWPVGLELQEEN
jgi:hypothetical protein